MSPMTKAEIEAERKRFFDHRDVQVKAHRDAIATLKDHIKSHEGEINRVEAFVSEQVAKLDKAFASAK